MSNGEAKPINQLGKETRNFLERWHSIKVTSSMQTYIYLSLMKKEETSKEGKRKGNIVKVTEKEKQHTGKQVEPFSPVLEKRAHTLPKEINFISTIQTKQAPNSRIHEIVNIPTKNKLQKENPQNAPSPKTHLEEENEKKILKKPEWS